MARAIFVTAVTQDGQAQRRRHEAATLRPATEHQADGVPYDTGVGIGRRKADRASPPPLGRGEIRPIEFDGRAPVIAPLTNRFDPPTWIRSRRCHRRAIRSYPNNAAVSEARGSLPTERRNTILNIGHATEKQGCMWSSPLAGVPGPSARVADRREESTDFSIRQASPRRVTRDRAVRGVETDRCRQTTNSHLSCSSRRTTTPAR